MNEPAEALVQELERLIDVCSRRTGKWRGKEYVRAGRIARALIVRWRAAGTWEEEGAFVRAASSLAIFERKDGTEVCALLVRALERVDTGQDSADVRLVADQFVRSAINTGADFAAYQQAARASPRLRGVPSVRRYIL